MKIENRLYKYSKYSKITNDCVDIVKKHISNEDIQKIEKIILQDLNEESDYAYAGGMYFLKKEDTSPYIELYFEQILQGIPKFLPKAKLFVNYAIIKMLLHEIGHHVNRKYAYEGNSSEWEKASSEYTVNNLWQIFRSWMYIFLTLGSLDKLINRMK